MRQPITIPGHHLDLLEAEHSRDIFIDGLIKISQGQHPELTKYTPVNEALADIAGGKLLPRTITNIPNYNDGSKHRLTPAWERRYQSVNRGFVPVVIGSGGSVKNLEFENITTMDKGAIESLARECKAAIKDRKRDQYRHWIEYIYSTLKFCFESDQLKAV